jgi:hypothetical protein
VLAVLWLLVVVRLLVLAARVATVALIATGMRDEIESLQARSTLMVVGYTTRESEEIVNHPTRHRIADANTRAIRWALNPNRNLVGQAR